MVHNIKFSSSFSESAYRAETSSVHPLILSMRKELTISPVDASVDLTRSGLALLLREPLVAATGN
jgi:hypothetical protein